MKRYCIILGIPPQEGASPMKQFNLGDPSSRRDLVFGIPPHERLSLGDLYCLTTPKYLWFFHFLPVLEIRNLHGDVFFCLNRCHQYIKYGCV